MQARSDSQPSARECCCCSGKEWLVLEAEQSPSAAEQRTGGSAGREEPARPTLNNAAVVKGMGAPCSSGAMSTAMNSSTLSGAAVQGSVLLEVTHSLLIRSVQRRKRLHL